jgi:hypothetical protein
VRLKTLFQFQGLYFLFSGLWPILHMPSFLFVTGPKTDLWLVKTVGALIIVISIPLLVAAARKKEDVELFLLSAGSAFTIACIELVYVSLKRISIVYLLDALIEVGIVVFGILSLRIQARRGLGVHPN